MRLHPQRLVSLWEMIFVELNVLAHSVGVLVEYQETVRICGDQNIQLNLDTEFRPNMNRALDNIIAISTRIGMPVTAHLARLAKVAFAATSQGSIPIKGPAMTVSMSTMKDVVSSLYNESSQQTAVVIDPARRFLFTQDAPLFGDAVSLKFAKVSGDIAEAGKCLALERPTACVFHLMRVVEYAVQRLGKKLHVQIDVEKEAWYQITLHINKAVDDLPSKTAPQRRTKQKYAAASAHLNSVRIATRNDVMHPKATYTDEEAQTLYDATKALMQQMAKIV